MLCCEKRLRAHNPTATAAGHPSGEAFRTDASLRLDSAVGTSKAISLETRLKAHGSKRMYVESDWSFNHTVKLVLQCSKNYTVI